MISFNKFEETNTKTISIVLTLQAFVSFIKIRSKKHVIMKNFDNENAVNVLDNSAYFCEKHGKKCGHTLQVVGACCIVW